MCVCVLCALMLPDARPHVFVDINYSGKVRRQRSVRMSMGISVCVCVCTFL